VDVPGSALASVLLALGDGLVLLGALDPTAFPWARTGSAVGGKNGHRRPTRSPAAWLRSMSVPVKREWHRMARGSEHR
jgi:hypothetical protein